MEIQDIIQQAAQEAAVSSLDAHGEYVDAETAWEFITGMWADTDDERLDTLLSDSLSVFVDGKQVMPAAFAAAYAQEVAK